MRAIGIVLAGGTGERFGRAGGKQLLQLDGMPVAWWSIRALAQTPSIDRVIVACHPQRVDEYVAALSGADDSVPVSFVAGGATRQESMASALAAAQCADDDVVAVHDGARPLVLPDVIEAAIRALVADPDLDGIVLGHPASDTLKQANGKWVARTLDRSVVWAAQTPQIFHARALKCAVDVARADGFVGTDDSALVEHSGGVVALFEAPRDNIKITVAEDAAVAEAILRYREEASR